MSDGQMVSGVGAGNDYAASRWVCSQCGQRGPEQGRCLGCGFDPLMDLDRSSVRDLLREHDDRRLDRARDRHRFIGVAVGMAIVIATWFIPHFWTVRRQLFALPFLADQILLMAVIGWGVLTVLDRRTPSTRFPWLDRLPPASRY